MKAERLLAMAEIFKAQPRLVEFVVPDALAERLHRDVVVTKADPYQRLVGIPYKVVPSMPANTLGMIYVLPDGTRQMKLMCFDVATPAPKRSTFYRRRPRRMAGK